MIIQGVVSKIDICYLGVSVIQISRKLIRLNTIGEFANAHAFELHYVTSQSSSLITKNILDLT